MQIEDKEDKPENICGSDMNSSSSSEVSLHSESITKNLDKLPKRIIVALDGSDFSFRAADYAINLAKLTGGRNTLCPCRWRHIIHRIYGTRYSHYHSLHRRGEKTDIGVVFKNKKKSSKTRCQVNIRDNFQSSINS